MTGWADKGDGMTDAKESRQARIHWLSLACTVAAVALAEALFTIEWSTAYCNDPYDGPSYAAYGVPLPYERFSGVASLLFEFAPHVFVLDIVLLSAAAYPLVRRAVDWATRSSPRLAAGFC